MADLLAELGSGLKTVGQTALAIPQAIGGGALDILIGDRTNVPVGEQVKRSIEALILAGDNPANLIGIHAMNAKRDAANAAIVDTPEFRRTMSVQQTVKNLTPEQAFDATAKLYGVSGYQPPTTLEAVDAPLHGADRAAGLEAPSLPERQVVPQLAPLGAGTLTKDLIARTQLGAMTQGSDLDQLLARYQASKLEPPIDLQRGAADEALRGEYRPGASSRTVSWNGKQLSVNIQDLKPEERFFEGDGAEQRGLKARAARQAWYDSIGDPTRVDLAQTPDGSAFTLLEKVPPAAETQARTYGAGVGENVPLGGAVTPDAQGRSIRQLKEEAATRPTGPEREHSATQTDLVTRLERLKQTYAEAQNQHLGGVLGGYVEALTQGQPTGPIAAWTKIPLARYTSLGTDAQRKLIREQAAIENQFIQSITGAQVSWQEAVRLARQLPNVNDAPEFFLQGIDTSVENLRSLEATKRELRTGMPALTIDEAKSALAEGRGGGGQGTLDTPATAPAAPPPPSAAAPSVMKLKSGKTVHVEY